MERNETRSGRSAPLAQVGLAALVAGSLLAFSALAFHTAFNDETVPGSLTANTPRVSAAAPVLLPASKSAISPTPPPTTTDQVAADETAATTIAATGVDPRGDVVLGTRVARTKAAARAAEVKDERRASHPAARPSVGNEDTHKNKVGKGHDKAHGKGHHKSKDHHESKDSKSSRDVEAREEEDDEWDDHGDDDDGRDDDDDSDSSSDSGSNSGGSGSHGSGDSHSGSSRD